MNRITNHPILEEEKPAKEVRILVDNNPITAREGEMIAAAAQTMINVNRVLPGRKVVMLGSGNVGIIVAYQLLQAGAEVIAILEAAPKLGGYGVHTAKVARAGVPF